MPSRPTLQVPCGRISAIPMYPQFPPEMPKTACVSCTGFDSYFLNTGKPTTRGMRWTTRRRVLSLRISTACFTDCCMNLRGQHCFCSRAITETWKILAQRFIRSMTFPWCFTGRMGYGSRGARVGCEMVMQAGVQSDGRPGISPTGEIDLGALGRALWRRKVLIAGLTLARRGHRVRRRQSHHAEVQVGSAGPDRDPREYFFPAGRGKDDRARHDRRPGSGDEPGPAHPVARSRARGHQEAQARRAAGIRSRPGRPQSRAHAIEPLRHHQGPNGHDARGAGVQELLSSGCRPFRWKNPA